MLGGLSVPGSSWPTTCATRGATQSRHRGQPTLDVDPARLLSDGRTAQLKEATPQLPTHEHLRALRSEIRRTIDQGRPDAVKQLLRDLVDGVEITTDQHAYPSSGSRSAAGWVTRTANPSRTRHRRPPNRWTPVGFSLHPQVEVRCRYSNLGELHEQLGPLRLLLSHLNQR